MFEAILIQLELFGVPLLAGWMTWLGGGAVADGLLSALEEPSVQHKAAATAATVVAPVLAIGLSLPREKPARPNGGPS